MKVKGLMAAILGLFALMILAPVSFAQVGKFGYVDSQRILSEFKELSKAQEEFNTQYKAWDDEAKNMQKDIDDMQSEYDKQKLILSPDKKKEREAAIDAKKQALDAYTRDTFGPGGAADKKNAELVKPLMEKINAAIERVATEGNYDFVFNSDGLVYAKKDYDITDKVLKILEE
ncbi:putative Outer membrane chaperone Skp (OmpH) [Candidatus Zixiibacteriota bacterium]|nr:putative Outer membrane chaperone Skp (OmpH) [candidate division Zixibacteria bacterium]